MFVSKIAMALVCVVVVAGILATTVFFVFRNYYKNDNSDSSN